MKNIGEDPIDNFAIKLSHIFNCNRTEALMKFIRTTGVSYQQLNDFLIKKSKDENKPSTNKDSKISIVWGP